MASAAYAFMRTFGMDEPMGCYDDFEAADAFVLWGSNMAEMHPILWTRLADRRLGHPHVKVAVLSTFTHRSSDLADIPIVFKPGTDLAILNYIANHIISTGRVNQDFVSNHTKLHERRDRYRLRPAARTSAADKGEGRGRPRQDGADRLRCLRAFVKDYTLEKRVELSGVEPEFLAGTGRTLRRPKSQGHVALDHGLQPACPRRLGQPDRLQSPSADGKNFRAGQQPVLAHRAAIGLRHGARGRHLRASPAGRHGGDQSRAPQACRGNLAACRMALMPEKPGYHAVEQDRMLHDGKLNFYWVQVNNNVQAAPNNSDETYPGYRNPDNFIVVSDAYPTVTAMAAI